MTPAESFVKHRTRHLNVTAAPSVHIASHSVKGKRKRTTDDDLAEADEILARSLQQQEWNVSGKSSSQTGKRARRVVLDSDSDNPSSPVKNDSFSVSAEHQIDPSQRRRNTRYNEAKGSAHRRLPSEPSNNDHDGIRDSDGESSSDESIFMPAQDIDPESSELSDESNGEALEQIAPSIGSRADIDGSVPLQPTTQAARRTRGPQASRRRGRHRRRGYEDRATRERKKLIKSHPEVTSMWDDLRAIPRIVPTQANQPQSITRNLKSFQLEGLDWMMKQEQSQWKGGLLGDEMGMGKTIQAVSLIMSDHPAKDPTLVVVPPVALLQWQNEIELYTNGKLNVFIYHNTNPKVKGLSSKDLRSFDVIMISYSGLESIYRKESKGWKRDDGLVKENSKIHALHYHRLILDEAHNIKTRTTSVAKACFALKANYKWCLSGTPVQNRIGEFFSLLRFLQITPFASYLCKKCPCARLHWSQDTEKRCSDCHHTGFEHVSVFNQELLNPITQQGDPELRRDGLRKLRLITDRIMLRRMKRDHTASMELPPKDVIVHNEFFGEIERDFSSSIMSNTARQFDTYVSRGVMLNNYANIFGLIMQVRCFVALCSRLRLVSPSSTNRH